MPPKNDDDRLDLDTPVEPSLKVDLTEDDDDEGREERGGGDDEKTPVDSGEKVRDPATGNWSSKKQAKGKDFKDKSAWKSEKADYDRRFADMEARNRQEISDLRAQIQQAQQRPAPGQPTDPYASAIGDVRKQLKSELELIERDDKRGYDRYNELREREGELIAQRTYAKMREQDRGQQPQNQNQPYQARREFLASEHPWINDPRNKGLTEKAWLIRQQLIGLDGRPDTLDTDREALSQAVARFGADYGLRVPAAPSPRTRQLYQGPAAGDLPRRNGPSPEETEVDVPRGLAAASGLTAEGLRRALRVKLDA